MANDSTVPPFPCVESTADFVANGLRVRIWRNEDPDPIHLKAKYDNDDIRELARSHAGGATSLAFLISGAARINAVHVQDAETGDGLVIYVVWP
jgi:hypothetical protein